MAVEINYSQTNGLNLDAFLDSSPGLACFMPICPYSFMANRAFLQEYLSWCLPRCSQTMIVVGDYLERHNIMAFEQVSEVEAIAKAEKRGRRIRRIIESVLLDMEPPGSVVVDSCRSDIESRDCQQIAETIRQYCGSSQTFRNDVENQVHLMLNGSSRARIKQPSSFDSQTMTQLREYIIEELALYVLLYQRGYTTEIYPGRDMKLLRNMAMGRYRGLPFDFSERTHISVAVLLDGGTSYAQLDENNDKGV